MNLSKYRKLIVAVLGVVGIVLGPTIFGVVGEEQWATITQSIIAAATALGVWGVPNES